MEFSDRVFTLHVNGPEFKPHHPKKERGGIGSLTLGPGKWAGGIGSQLAQGRQRRPVFAQGSERGLGSCPETGEPGAA